MYEADNRDRTGGLRITSASLYLLSHIGKLYYSIRYKSVCQIKILGGYLQKGIDIIMYIVYI